MHNISNLFYFGTTLYMFRTAFPSIIRSLRLYIQHHTLQVLWLLASKQPQNLFDMLQHAATQQHNKQRRNFTEYFNINITLARFSASFPRMVEDRNM